MSALPRYSRFRAVAHEGGWRVVAECGLPAPEPATFAEYAPALQRADALNAAEVADFLAGR